MNTLLCFGFGYCARALASHLTGNGGWHIIGTSRTPSGVEAISATGFEGLRFDMTTDQSMLQDAIARSTHVLMSVPPDSNGDPILRTCTDALGRTAGLRWLGYLSTVGVYGDSGGAWVDEETAPKPSHERAERRLAAESAWLAFGTRTGKNVQIFRIAGIYGPERNLLADLKQGTVRRIEKPGQVFNRIHVADIAQCLAAAMARGRPGRVYNVTDDKPAAPEDVLSYAAQLLELPLPPSVPLEEAKLSPMAASFYAGNRRVRNARIKSELGVALRFPTYREGLDALFKDEG